MQDRFGKLFGGRTSIPSYGINNYLGQRLSSRPKLSPSLGPGTTFHADYHRMHYSQDHLHPYLQSKVSHASFIAKQIATNLNQTFISFVGDETCSRLIWTQGSLPRTNNG